MTTGIHTFHITDTCLWTNIPATLYTYVPLHFYCSLLTDLTLLQTTLTHIYHTIAKYVPETYMTLKWHKYSIFPKYFHAFMEQVHQHMHVWGCSLNDTARCAVHWWQWWCSIMTTQEDKDTTAQLHLKCWPLDQIRQKAWHIFLNNSNNILQLFWLIRKNYVVPSL